MLLRIMRHGGFEHFLYAFVAEIDAANHEKRRDRPGKDVAKDQRDGQQDQELVAKRPRRDPSHDRQQIRSRNPA